MIRPDLYTRWRQRQGAVTMHVEPGKITKADGTVITTGLFGAPLDDNALAFALRISEPGEVIGVRGRLKGVSIGSVNPGHWSHSNRAIRPGNEPLPKTIIVPDDNLAEQPMIGNITVEGDSREHGGVSDLTIAGLNVVNERYWDYQKKKWASGKCHLLVAHFIETGAMRVLFNTFTADDVTIWQGYPVMWTGRYNGLVEEADFEYNECPEALEHSALYADNVGYHDSRSIHNIIGNVVSGRGGGRTCFQFVNRGNSGRSGGGFLKIEDNVLRTIGGGGGGAITVAGHAGPVRIVSNDIECDGAHSGLVIWTDDYKGVHRTGSGHSTGRVLIKNLTVRGGNRPHVAISGAERVRIEQSFLLMQANGDGPKTCIDLDNQNGGSIDNGPVEFINCTSPMSSYAGFASGTKVKRSDATLSNAQIDAMMVGQ